VAAQPVESHGAIGIYCSAQHAGGPRAAFRCVARSRLPGRRAHGAVLGHVRRLAPAPPVVSQAPTLADLVSEAISIRVPTRSATEYADAARRYRAVLDRLKIVDAARLDWTTR